MLSVKQFILSVLSVYSPIFHSPDSQHGLDTSESLAIVGAGSAGLAMLKTTLDLPPDLRQDWRIELFEEREDVGGVWLPDYRDVSPPEIPETPLYPQLHTNTPVPSMTYPGFPFPAGTALYPRHQFIHAYHRRYAEKHNLLPHIRFQHKIRRASWIGDSQSGHWELEIQDNTGNISIQHFNHLVIASGNNHIPRVPAWSGQNEWLSNNGSSGFPRSIVHAVYYRKPEAFSNQSVLVIGNGASGRDIASQVSEFARETYVSIRHPGGEDVDVPTKPEILRFTQNHVEFVDGTTLEPDVVILGTGYELRKPFLDTGGSIVTDPTAHDNSSVDRYLTTNLRYIFPLYRHILSLSPAHPTNALAFLGLPTRIANCPSDIAQSLFAAHAIFNSTILPSRAEALKELGEYENHVRELGFDPYKVGHEMLNGTSSDYQDELVDYLKEKGVIPNDGKKYVEQWRRDIFNYQYMKRGWKHIEELGTGQEWTKNVSTEAEWADLMRRVNEWQRHFELRNNIPFQMDADLAG